MPLLNKDLKEQFWRLWYLRGVLEMDNTVCTCKLDMVYSNQIYQQTKVDQTSETSVWDGFRQLVGAIGEFALEVLRGNDAPDPVFSDGGTRVLIRPDRIDLVSRETIQ